MRALPLRRSQSSSAQLTIWPSRLVAAFGRVAAYATTAVPRRPLSVDRQGYEHVQRVRARSGGSISATARSLGMHRRTLQRKLSKRPVRD